MPETKPESTTPQELFTAKTFGTLGGCVMAAGVAATVICAVFGTDPKKVGLIASIIVAYVPLLLHRKRRTGTNLVVAPFNGCLIFFTLVGASSFYPYVNQNTAAAAATGPNDTYSAFSPWVPDANLVSTSRNLHSIVQEQGRVLGEVSNTISSLEVQTKSLSVPPAVKAELEHNISNNKEALRSAAARVTPHVTALKKLGIHPIEP